MLRKLLGFTFFGLLSFLFLFSIISEVFFGLVPITDIRFLKLFVSIFCLSGICFYISGKLVAKTTPRDTVDYDRERGAQEAKKSEIENRNAS